MSEDKKPLMSKTVQMCSFVFLLIGFGVFQALAPSFFPAQPGGINFEQTMWAGIVGGVSGMIGFGIGKVIVRLRD